MNLAKAKRDELLGPLSVSGIIERRHTLPILSNVLIERSGDALGFLATDIEIQIAARSGIGGRRGARGHRRRAQAARHPARCPTAPRSRCSSRTSACVVKGGKSRFACRRSRPRTFRASPSPPASRPSSNSSRAAAPPAFARAIRDGAAGHPLLPERLADGRRGRQPKLGRDRRPPLAYAALKLGAQLPRQEVIVPRKTVLELTKLLADSDAPVKIELSATQAAFSFGTIELVSKLIDGKFPDYTRVIPTGHKNRCRRRASRCARRCSAPRSCRTKSSAACAGCWATAA